MDTNFNNTIRLSDHDNVVVARTQLEIGMLVNDSRVTITEHIGAGHKIATEKIKKGSVIRKYNQAHFIVVLNGGKSQDRGYFYCRFMFESVCRTEFTGGTDIYYEYDS